LINYRLGLITISVCHWIMSNKKNLNFLSSFSYPNIITNASDFIFTRNTIADVWQNFTTDYVSCKNGGLLITQS